ncbi:hypothetical protein GFER_16020 [Geoalkalibacter ferrihydriticus DSM 17813]|uniref:DUF2283 domain-containing protein n=1 Tax=Geoalkalibacter ferrihydriticus DSM 17813 TaxID=1121915 RepID=A0A0C2HRR8_9BACT|nr:DUF2283 domain-containing protein [Geoalkalibacter ferrihydriticus]KIH75467.1 hypothetical protein GFER_16020 [Geoalkalibacter ferrihydriticus DSM 17813]
MKIKYFSDTDTALVEFSDKEVAETREINENIYIDLDSDGSLVSMTIEHAKEKANIAELSFIQMTGSQLS